MKRFLIPTLISLAVFMISYFLWFVVWGKVLFATNQFIPFFHPVGIFLILVINLIICKLVYKVDYRFIAISSILIIVLFSSLTNVLINRYNLILNDYFSKNHGDTLISFIDYSSEKGNYVILTRELKKNGIYPSDIRDGEYAHEINDSSEFSKVCYLVYSKNKANYILFDWSTNEVLDITPIEVLFKKIEEKYPHIDFSLYEPMEGAFDVLMYYKDEDTGKDMKCVVEILPGEKEILTKERFEYAGDIQDRKIDNN